jgi:predicted dehydrogenase
MRAVIEREPREIYTHAWNPPWSKFQEPPEATAIVRFDGDVPVTYHGSWLSNGPHTPWAGDWRMNFAEGEVWWSSRGGVRGDPVADDVVTVRRRDEEPTELPLPVMEHLDRAGSLQAFKTAIETGRQPETSGRANLATLALTLAAVESAASGVPIVFEERGAATAAP